MQPLFISSCCCRHSACFNSFPTSCIISQPSEADELSSCICPTPQVPFALCLIKKRSPQASQPFSIERGVPCVSIEPFKHPQEIGTCCIQVTWEAAWAVLEHSPRGHA